MRNGFCGAAIADGADENAFVAKEIQFGVDQDACGGRTSAFVRDANPARDTAKAAGTRSIEFGRDAKQIGRTAITNGGDAIPVASNTKDTGVAGIADGTDTIAFGRGKKIVCDEQLPDGKD